MPLGTERRFASLAARDAEEKTRRAHASSGTLHSECWGSRSGCLFCVTRVMQLSGDLPPLARRWHPSLRQVGPCYTGLRRRRWRRLSSRSSSLGRLISRSARLRMEKGAATATPRRQAGAAGTVSHGEKLPLRTVMPMHIKAYRGLDTLMMSH